MRFYNILLIFVFILITNCNNSKDNKPTDFDNFWAETIQELGTKITFEKKRDSIVGEKRWNLYKIKSYKEVYFYAWVSEPIAYGKFPIKIRFQGFGRGGISINKPPHEWFLKEGNSINMVVDIRGQGLSTEQVKFENYLTNGLGNKNNYIYRGAYMDAFRSVDFIASNPKSDGNIIVNGGSQGGTLSIVAAALNSKVTMCIVGFPFLTDIGNYNKSKWPMNVLIHDAIKNDIDLVDLKETLSYFDILNFSDKIKVPIFIRAEEKDDITPPEGAIKLFNQIKVKNKEMYIVPCEGHGCSSNSQKANNLEKLFIVNNMY